MLSHPLPNLEKQKYSQKESKFNGAYSRNNLPQIKNRSYVINLDQFRLIRSHWISLCVNGNNTSFHSYGVEHISKEI